MTFQSNEALSDTFRTLLKTQPAWLPKNVRRIKWTTISAEPNCNAFGLLCDASEQTGKVVYCDEAILVLKVKPSQYCVIDAALIKDDRQTSLGKRVTAFPYKRKSLEDGLALDAPRCREPGVQTILIGETRTKLPGRPQDGYLSHLADQLEACPMPDGYRTMANALADWKATAFRWIQEGSTLTYEMHCLITSPLYAGPLTILYDRGTDTYALRHGASHDTGAPDKPHTLAQIKDIHFDELSTHLSDLAGDEDTWCRVRLVPAAT